MSCDCETCGCNPCNCEEPCTPDLDNLNEQTPVLALNGEPRECCDDEDPCLLAIFSEDIGTNTVDAEPVDDYRTFSVCAASRYQIGTCVLVAGSNSTMPGAGRTPENVQTFKITAHLTDTEIQVQAFNNAWTDFSGQATGTIKLFPLQVCPDELAAGEGCDRFHMILAEAFTVPAVDSSIEITLEHCVELVVGMSLYVQGAGCFTLTSQDDALGYEFTITNNTATPGVIIPAGNYLVIQDHCDPEDPEIVSIPKVAYKFGGNSVWKGGGYLDMTASGLSNGDVLLLTVTMNATCYDYPSLRWEPSDVGGGGWSYYGKEKWVAGTKPYMSPPGVSTTMQALIVIDDITKLKIGIAFTDDSCSAGTDDIYFAIMSAMLVEEL